MNGELFGSSGGHAAGEALSAEEAAILAAMTKRSAEAKACCLSNLRAASAFSLDRDRRSEYLERAADVLLGGAP